MTVVKSFFLLLLLSVKAVSAEESGLNASQLLRKMTHAMETLNYQGTVAFLRNGKLETMKYFHAAEKGKEQERLLSLNSPLREIVRDADRVSCVFKSTKQILIDHRPVGRSFLIDIPKNLDELKATYSFKIAGEEEVAMLPTYVIAIQPKDNFRYVRKIWMEKQHFLPLKVALYDLSGTILEQFVFTDLQVKDTLPFVEVKTPPTPNRRQPKSLPHPKVSIKQVAKLQSQASDGPDFDLTELPPGFRKIFFTRRPLHNSDQSVAHLLLSDGFSSISIYRENKNPAMQAGLQSVGAINFFSRIIDDSQLTVMGEVPAATVKLIAEGIQLKDTND
ncbi:Sigma-E factor negative regulatory protein RseB [Candidatus Methylobacter favarea]|uniref:Sigma-E factor negative regulatory protein RseB n=1 Tax=Candidatus Methylobacter favarea TaxID=2707345 RepID=A0A8S0XI45_9GAMM|nr:MucB/RseB C-terminal domain-containing protein [Candidatus Methylobacter favarea]CAA9892303.1 Sigma-E factor negative regulatory protein RseB [Candidatus Methylobacter favarea]